MKQLLLACVLGLVVTLEGSVHEEAKYQFTVTRSDYRFSTSFDIDSDSSYEGMIKKSSFRLRTQYDLSNADGWQASGIRRIFSLGVINEWGAAVDVYDTRWVRIGLIKGQLFTAEQAKFNLYEYNEEGTAFLLGVAYLDQGAESFTIYCPEDRACRIAKLKRTTVVDARDYWTVQVFYPEMIDDRMIRIFAAFAVDTQSAFRLDDVDVTPLDPEPISDE